MHWLNGTDALLSTISLPPRPIRTLAPIGGKMNTRTDTLSTGQPHGVPADDQVSNGVSTTEIAASDPPIVQAPPAPTNQPQQPTTAPVDWEQVRADFPIMTRRVHDKPLVFLD